MRRNYISFLIIGTFSTALVIGYTCIGTINALGQNILTYTTKNSVDFSDDSNIHIDENLQIDLPKVTPEEIQTPAPPTPIQSVIETDSQKMDYETQTPVPFENDDNADSANIKGDIPENEANNGQIVLLGDSITEGLSIYGFFKDAHIIGVNSLNTISAREQVNNVSIFKPAKLFILLGINDLWEGGSVDEFIERYKSLIEKIKANTTDCSIYIETIFPVSKYAMERNPLISNKVIDEANMKIEKMTKDLNINYIDVNSILKDKDGNLISEYSNDGVHLINNYYPVWTDKLASYMK